MKNDIGRESLVSICMLCYNHAKYIEESIQSILIQNYPNLEIIVLDDGSTDDSINLLGKFSNIPYLKIIKQRNSGNIAKNLNILISEAKGDYILIISCDDKLVEDSLAVKVNLMQNNKNLVFVASKKYYDIDSDSRIMKDNSLDNLNNSITIDELLELEYEDLHTFYIQGALFRKSIIDEIGRFDENLLGDDIVLRIKLFMHLKNNKNLEFKFIDTYGFFYRTHDSNVHKNINRQILLASQIVNKFFPDKKIPLILEQWICHGIRELPFKKMLNIFINKKIEVNLLFNKNILNCLIQLLKKKVKATPKYLKFYFIKLYKEIFLCFDKGNIYQDKILLSDVNSETTKNVLIIFSHYDKDNVIDDYVVHYLTELKKLECDILFVSTSEKMTESETNKISSLCCQVIVKQNIGYDFGAWRTGIEIMSDKLEYYEQLILCNDSVYAPLFDLNQMFRQMDRKFDFWGISDNYEHEYHIQSYFMVFSRKVFQEKYFLDFWKNIKVFKHKENIVRNYEIGLTKLLRNKKHTYRAYSPSQINDKRNSTHYYWEKLILDQRAPIIKIELLRDNPIKIDISNWENILLKNTNFDVNMIKNHLKRIKKLDNKTK